MVGGAHPLEGRLEICVNSEWGTVCNDGFDTSAAMVVCRQLGIKESGNIKTLATTVPILWPCVLYTHIYSFMGHAGAYVCDSHNVTACTPYTMQLDMELLVHILQLSAIVDS